MPRDRLRLRSLEPGAALLPLRIFLGGTFVYAGVQKLSDPGFLNPGAPTYIGTQLRGFAHGTPGGFLLRALAIPHPKLAGVGVALIEVAIGLLALGGLVTRVAAAGGLSLSLVLFLTNSWHTTPYFLGSDIVFVFAWLPFVLAGAAGQPAVDHVLGRWAADGPPWSRAGARASIAGAGRASPGARITRRGVLAQALGLTGLGALAIGGVAALLKGSYRGGAPRLAGGGTAAGARSPGPTPATATSKPPQAPAAPPGAVALGPSSQLPSGQAASYTDPVTGQPDIVIRQGGQLRSFSAVCTHAGCQVQYSGGQIVCPCHGGTFDASTGAVVSGPPPQGLAPRKVVERGGTIYALRS